jgi:hypothetical protein
MRRDEKSEPVCPVCPHPSASRSLPSPLSELRAICQPLGYFEAKEADRHNPRTVIHERAASLTLHQCLAHRSTQGQRAQLSRSQLRFHASILRSGQAPISPSPLRRSGRHRRARSSERGTGRSYLHSWQSSEPSRARIGTRTALQAMHVISPAFGTPSFPSVGRVWRVDIWTPPSSRPDYVSKRGRK